MRIAVRVDIEAPVETVWAFLDDGSRLALWMPEVVETDFPKDYDRDNPVGTHFRQTIREGGRKKIYLGEVTLYDRLRLLGLHLSDGRLEVDVVYRLGPMGTGSRLDYEARVAVRRWYGWIAALAFRPLTRRILARHLANLKRLAEDAAVGIVTHA